jgi:hypothetical protein
LCITYSELDPTPRPTAGVRSYVLVSRRRAEVGAEGASVSVVTSCSHPTVGALLDIDTGGCAMKAYQPSHGVSERCGGGPS